MSAAQSRRPLPALIFVGALTVLSVLVWFRVLNRSEQSSTPSPSVCRSAPVSAPRVLPYPGNVSVLVLNAANRNGLAALTQKALGRRGFNVAQIDNDGPKYGGPGVLRAVGQIRYGPQARLAATLLHYYLPAASLRTTDSPSATVILSLGTRYTKLFSGPAVIAQLRAHGVTLSSKAQADARGPARSC